MARDVGGGQRRNPPRSPIPQDLGAPGHSLSSGPSFTTDTDPPVSAALTEPLDRFRPEQPVGAPQKIGDPLRKRVPLQD